MYYGKLKKVDSANGPGVRVVLFVSGCRNQCKNCFNPETWAFDYGTLYTEDTEKEILEALDFSYIDGITVLGGESFEEENQPQVAALLQRVRRELPKKDIWCYTGYTLEKDLCMGGRKYTESTEKILECLDVLVDGRFVEEQKNLTLQFRGSANQRLIDMKKTREAGKIVLWEE